MILLHIFQFLLKINQTKCPCWRHSYAPSAPPVPPCDVFPLYINGRLYYINVQSEFDFKNHLETRCQPATSRTVWRLSHWSSKQLRVSSVSCEFCLISRLSRCWVGWSIGWVQLTLCSHLEPVRGEDLLEGGVANVRGHPDQQLLQVEAGAQQEDQEGLRAGAGDGQLQIRDLPSK